LELDSQTIFTQQFIFIKHL